MNNDPHIAYTQIEQGLAAWAAGRDDIRAVVVIGSRARTRRPADAWSDLDAIVLVDDTTPYRASGHWRTTLEAAFDRPVWLGSLEFIDDETPDWEFVLEGGLKVDLSFSANRAPGGRAAPLEEIAAACPLHFAFDPGARVLVDQTPGPPWQPQSRPPNHPTPDQTAFDNRIANILNDLVRAVRLSGRGEAWRAAKAINTEVRGSLLDLIGWHARAQNRPGSADWGYGRFLEEWADPRVVAALPRILSDGSRPSTRRAVRACLDLLAWFVPETASLLGLAGPAVMVSQVSGWMLEILDEMPD